MKAIPVHAAKTIADDYGYDQVVVIARKVDTRAGIGGPMTKGGEHVTTYGASVAHCEVAARIGNFIKHRIMQWPEQADVKDRLDALQGKFDELSAVAKEILETDDAAILELRNLGFQAPLETHELPNKLRAVLQKIGVIP